jgi:hypothetical protein
MTHRIEAMGAKAAHVRAAPNDDHTHTCHWPGCTRQVKPALFSCKPHWFTWPESIRNAIWREYRPGQEISKTPSEGYLRAAEAAIMYARDYERAKAARAPGQGELPL